MDELREFRDPLSLSSTTAPIIRPPSPADLAGVYRGSPVLPASAKSTRKQLIFETPQRGRSPSKAVIMETGADGASPMRIKVTVEAQPLDDGETNISPGTRKRPTTRTRKITVPLNDEDDVQSTHGKGKTRRSATPAVKKRKPTPARRRVSHIEDAIISPNSLNQSPTAEQPQPTERRGRPRKVHPAQGTPVPPAQNAEGNSGIEAPNAKISTSPKTRDGSGDTSIHREDAEMSYFGDDRTDRGLKPRALDIHGSIANLVPARLKNHTIVRPEAHATESSIGEELGKRKDSNVGVRLTGRLQPAFSPLPPRRDSAKHVPTPRHATGRVQNTTTLNDMSLGTNRQGNEAGEESDLDKEMWRSMILDHKSTPRSERIAEAALDPGSGGTDYEEIGSMTGIIPGDETMMQSEEFSIVSVHSLPSANDVKSNTAIPSARETESSKEYENAVAQSDPATISRGESIEFLKMHPPVNQHQEKIARANSSRASPYQEKVGPSSPGVSRPTVAAVAVDDRLEEAATYELETTRSSIITRVGNVAPVRTPVAEPHMGEERPAYGRTVPKQQIITPAMTPDLPRLPTPGSGDFESASQLPAATPIDIASNESLRQLNPDLTDSLTQIQDENSAVNEATANVSKRHFAASDTRFQLPLQSSLSEEDSYLRRKTRLDRLHHKPQKIAARESSRERSEQVGSTHDIETANIGTEQPTESPISAFDFAARFSDKNKAARSSKPSPLQDDVDLWEEEASRASEMDHSTRNEKATRTRTSISFVESPTASSLMHTILEPYRTSEAHVMGSPECDRQTTLANLKANNRMTTAQATTPARQKKMATDIDAIFRNIAHDKHEGEGSDQFESNRPNHQQGLNTTQKPNSEEAASGLFKIPVKPSFAKQSKQSDGGQVKHPKKRRWNADYSRLGDDNESMAVDRSQTSSAIDLSMASDIRQLRSELRPTVENVDPVPDLVNKRRKLNIQVQSEEKVERRDDIMIERLNAGTDHDDRESSDDTSTTHEDDHVEFSQQSTSNHPSSSMLRLTPPTSKTYKPLFSSSPLPPSCLSSRPASAYTPRPTPRRVHFSPIPLLSPSGPPVSPEPQPLFSRLLSYIPFKSHSSEPNRSSNPPHPTHRLLQALPLLPNTEPWTRTHYKVLDSLYQHFKAHPADFSPAAPANAALFAADPAIARFVDIQFVNWGYGVRLSAPLITLALLFHKLLVLDDIAHYERVVGYRIDVGSCCPGNPGDPIRWWDVLVRLFSVVAGEMVREDERRGVPIRRTRGELRWKFVGDEDWTWNRDVEF